MSGQNIDQLFDEPWFLGSPAASNSDVPAFFQVAIAGHGYTIEPAKYSRVTVPLQRESTDQSVEPGEQTLNTSSAWRRSQDNWFLGAGQEFLDNKFGFVAVYMHSGEDPSVRTRFWRSKGVDPWTEGAMSLLAEYSLAVPFTGNPQVISVGNTVYAAGVAANLLSADSASFEASLGTWGAYANCTIAASTAQALSGTQSMEMTASAAGEIAAATAVSGASVIPVTAGQVYTGMASFRAATTARDVQVVLNWYTAAGAFISYSIGTQVLESGWTEATVTGTAPATATYVALVAQVLAAAASEVHYVDCAMIVDAVATTWVPGGAVSVLMFNSGSGWNFVGEMFYGGSAWGTIHSLTTDGNRVYVGLGASGIAVTTAGSAVSTPLRPAAPIPTVVPAVTGATTWDYYVVATDTNGYKSLPSGAGYTTTGTATLTATDYNEVTWASVPGAVSYDLLRTDTAHSVALGLTATSFTDTGIVASAYTAPGLTTDLFPATFVQYANGFLLAGNGPNLCSVAANGTTTTVLTHFNPNWLWTAGCSSPMAVYVAGNAGGNSEIYGIQLSTTTFALGAPYIAGQVTDGEIVNDMCYYQGLVILATSLGVRTAEDQNQNGHLTTGPVIANLGGSDCLAPYGRFVWFGVSNYAENDGVWQGTTTTSGLGRLSLSEYTSSLLPAYATDAMSTVGGVATGVAVVNDVPWFAVAGSGVWTPTGNLVPQGWFETGWVRYGTVAEKILISADVRHDPLNGEVQVEIVPFGGTSFLTPGSTEAGSSGPPYYISTGDRVGEAFMVIPILTRSATDPTKGPVLRRWTTRAMVRGIRQDQIVVPIIWADEVLSPVGDGTRHYLDLVSEWEFLKGLEQAGTAFIYQEGALVSTAFIDQVELQARKWNDQKQMLEGILSVKLLTVN